jgi:hypothetical protein
MSIPVIIFATMRRSGSHFLMHRTLASVEQRSPMRFGAHVNSIGWGKFKRKGPVDSIATVCRRKQNHYYTNEAIAAPRSGGDPIGFQCQMALEATLRGQPASFSQNPSGMKPTFVAINIEDTPCDEVYDKAAAMLAGIVCVRESLKDATVFVVVRALRSIALSRKKWVEKNGEKNIMASGFKKLDADVWEDHYTAARDGRTKAGRRAVPLHYGEAVATHGESARAAFASANEQFGLGLSMFRSVPDWVLGSVLSDGGGSSFAGSGREKAATVERSLADRAPRLQEFSSLFESSRLAAEHAEIHGEL